MTGRKRSERLAEREVAIKPAPVPVVPRVAERVISAFCPCCGRTIPEMRAIKIGHVAVDHIRYFDSIDWDENKPFGMSYPAAGRGSLRDWKHISSEDAPELFEAVKTRFLQALREWLKKGWLEEEEIL